MKGKSHLWLLILVFCLLFFGGRPIQGQPSANPALDAAIARSLQATVDALRVNRSAADLQVAEAHTVTVLDLAFTAYAVKILDPQQERIYQYWYRCNGLSSPKNCIILNCIRSQVPGA